MKKREPLDRPSDYQARDIEIIDYKMTDLPGTLHRIRGPLPDLAQGGYITCIGAAQTFGCFCEKPYPTLLGQQFERPVLNLGLGGTGPEFFLEHPELIEVANRGALTVLQVMSGRVQPNVFFDGYGLARVHLKRTGKNVHPHVAWNDIAEGFYAWRRMPALAPLVRFAAHAPLALAIAQSRKGWVSAYAELIARLKTPTIVLWFSRRTPEYPRKARPIADLMGDYPQLVSRDWMQPLETMADAYVELVSDRGTPQILRRRGTDEPITIDMSRDSALYEGQFWSENSYYPTPEMHEDAASAMYPHVYRLLKGAGAM